MAKGRKERESQLGRCVVTHLRRMSRSLSCAWVIRYCTISLVKSDTPFRRKYCGRQKYFTESWLTSEAPNPRIG